MDEVNTLERSVNKVWILNALSKKFFTQGEARKRKKFQLTQKKRKRNFNEKCIKHHNIIYGALSAAVTADKKGNYGKKYSAYIQLKMKFSTLHSFTQ